MSFFILSFAPQIALPPVAADASQTVFGGSRDNSLTPAITQSGSPVAPDALLIDQPPAHGTVSVSGAGLLYTPTSSYLGTDSFTYHATVGGTSSNVAAVTLNVVAQYNCDCDDGIPTETLADLRTYLMVRLGFAAMLNAPPPGMTELLNSFLIEAQKLLYTRYKLLRLERWFTWDMTAGARFYDLAANADTCTKKLDPRRVSWVGISQGDNCWRPLVCGIDPLRYSYQGLSIPDSYEIRQCIEVFPAPADGSWKLRIKGDFGLLPFAADTDVTTIDPDTIKLHALAYAKAHYGQPDAANLMSALTTFLGDLTAATHQTRRYIPGQRLAPPAIPPKVVS